MSSYGEQNGRQTATAPVQSAAPSDPRIRNVTSNPNMSSSDSHVDVCRNYVWGICNKHGQCKYRHECTLDEMKCIINFCHNYQNRNGCNLPNCTYLHTSKEEETLFRTTGQLPRVLMERHAAMRAAAASNTHVNMSPMDNVPPMFMAHTVPQPHLMTSTAPMPPPVPTIMPPPPPPPPPTESSVVTPTPSVIFTAPPPTRIPLNQRPPPLPSNFDASVPPPSIKNRNLVRTINDINFEAGPSKLRKADDGKAAENMCEKCIQRELSSDMYLTEVENLNRQKEYKKIILKSKLEETENMKTMMRCLLPTEIGLAVEEYMNEQPSTSLGVSVPMQLMMHKLLENRISINSSNMLDTIQPSSMRELLISCLLNTSSDRTPSPEFFNGLEGRAASTPQVPPPIRPPIPPPVSQRAPAASTPRAYPSVAAAVPAPTASAPPAFTPYQPGAPPPVAPPVFAPPPFQPGVPPPSSSTFAGFAPPPFQPGVPPPPLRAAYPPAYAPGPPAPYPAVRPPAPPAAAPPAPPAPPPSNGHYAPYMLGGYSSHQYYPPYQ